MVALSSLVVVPNYANVVFNVGKPVLEHVGRGWERFWQLPDHVLSERSVGIGYSSTQRQARLQVGKCANVRYLSQTAGAVRLVAYDAERAASCGVLVGEGKIIDSISHSPR